MDLNQEKAELQARLKTAIALEFATIPPYMMALVSIQPRANRVAAEKIRAVMMEEMLHMTLVANLINSLGGAVELGPDTIPHYPLRLEFEAGKCFKDREFDVNLMRFSQAQIETFLQIELPEDWAQGDQAPDEDGEEMEIEGLSIGQFYNNIIEKLRQLCEQFDPQAVFSGNPAQQVSQDYYWAGGGKPIVIHNFDSAKFALETIISQGEGSSTSIYDGDDRHFGQPAELAHFYSFREIWFGQHYQPGDQPRQPPTGEKFVVDYAAVYPIKANPVAADYANDPAMAQLNQQFNRHYTLMLMQLQDAFSGNPKALYTAIMNGMHGMVPIAMKMVTQAIHGQAEHGAPSFDWLPPS